MESFDLKRALKASAEHSHCPPPAFKRIVSKRLRNVRFRDVTEPPGMSAIGSFAERRLLVAVPLKPPVHLWGS